MPLRGNVWPRAEGPQSVVLMHIFPLIVLTLVIILYLRGKVFDFKYTLLAKVFTCLGFVLYTIDLNERCERDAHISFDAYLVNNFGIFRLI